VRGRLFLLNVVLAAAAVLVSMRARDNWLEARKRADLMLGRKVKPAPAPPFSPLPALERVSAASYADIAQKTLFSADRNPTVVVEVAPPKPMPPLPTLQGVMDLGDGPIAIMTAKKGERQRSYHTGESVGEFKLVSIASRELVFEWDGKQIAKRFDELIDRSAPAQTAAGQAEPPARPAITPAPVVNTASTPKAYGPGKELAPGLRACQAGDDAAEGAVVDGYKKVVTKTPFGDRCRWEAVR